MANKFGLTCVKCNTEQLTRALEQADYSMFKFGNVTVMKNQYIKEDVHFILKCKRDADGRPFEVQLENGLVVMGNNENVERGCVIITDAFIITFDEAMKLIGDK